MEISEINLSKESTFKSLPRRTTGIHFFELKLPALPAREIAVKGLLLLGVLGFTFKINVIKLKSLVVRFSFDLSRWMFGSKWLRRLIGNHRKLLVIIMCASSLERATSSKNHGSRMFKSGLSGLLRLQLFLFMADRSVNRFRVGSIQ